MKPSRNCVLVLAQQHDDIHWLANLLHQLCYPLIVVDSIEQVLSRTAEHQPCLIILSGNYQSWSHNLVANLRSHHQQQQVTIVALTDFHAPSWLHQEENPGLDGFLVKPLSCEVLVSLVQSAWVRQACYSLS